MVDLNLKGDRKGRIFLVTGLSGAGKSTIGRALTSFLNSSEKSVYFLDGDDVRDFFGTMGKLNENDRLEQSKKLAFGATLLSSKGIDVIIGVTLGQKVFRDYFESRFDFIEIFLDADVEDCIQNDPKGFYKERLILDKPNMRGVDMPFDETESPGIIVKTHKETVEDSLEKIKVFLKKINYL